MDRFTVGVVGAGRMGTGIAQAIAAAGFPVRLADLDVARAEAGRRRIEGSLAEAAARGWLDPAAAASAVDRIAVAADLGSFRGCRVVVEAVAEDHLAKKNLLRVLDRVLDPEGMLATNTSSFYVTELASVTERPGQVVGLHYFLPAARNPLVEVASGALTREDAARFAETFVREQGKTPIRVKDAPGFAINRFLLPLVNEAARIVEEGLATVPTVDEALRRAFGAPAGPFAGMNASGVQVTLKAAETLGVELGPFYEPCDLLRAHGEEHRPFDLSGPIDEAALPALEDRLVAVPIAVAGLLVDEQVARPGDIDLGARIGLRWQVGPLEAARALGRTRALSLVEELAARHPDIGVAVALRALPER